MLLQAVRIVLRFLRVDQRDIALDVRHHALEPCRAAVIGRSGGYGTDGGRLVLGPFRVPHPQFQIVRIGENHLRALGAGNVERLRG